MAWDDIAKYTNKSSWSTGLDSIDGLSRWLNRFWNASIQSGVHLKLRLPRFISSKNGMHLSVAFEINLLSTATFLARLCTSLICFGYLIFRIAIIWSGLISIPRELTMNPWNFPDATPNEHFKGFSFIPYFRRISNISAKSLVWSDDCLDFTNMSSMYASIVFPIWL